MLNFIEAMRLVNEGKKVTRKSSLDLNTDWVMYKHEDELLCSEKEFAFGEDTCADGALVEDLTTIDYLATDWVEVTGTLDEDESYMYLHPEKNRWVSTTNPAKHKQLGHQVAIFEYKTDL